MTPNPLLRRPKRILILAAVTAMVLLTACSSKPPGCADEQTVGLAKEIILDQWKERTAATRSQDEFSPYVDAYANGLKVEVRNIVSDGYNAEARKHSCTGEILLKTISGATFSASRNFTSQATADGNKKFVVQIAAVEPLVRSLTNDLFHYMADENAKRLDAKKAEATSQLKQDTKPSSTLPPASVTAEPVQPLSPAPATQTKDASAPPPASTKVESKGPSFDCSKVTTQVEREICEDPKLAELDLAVVSAYNVALSKEVDKHAVKAEQITWMRKVRNACTSAQCLLVVYQRRLSQLN